MSKNEQILMSSQPSADSSSIKDLSATGCTVRSTPIMSVGDAINPPTTASPSRTITLTSKTEDSDERFGGGANVTSSSGEVDSVIASSTSSATVSRRTGTDPVTAVASGLQSSHHMSYSGQQIGEAQTDFTRSNSAPHHAASRAQAQWSDGSGSGQSSSVASQIPQLLSNPWSTGGDQPFPSSGAGSRLPSAATLNHQYSEQVQANVGQAPPSLISQPSLPFMDSLAGLSISDNGIFDQLLHTASSTNSNSGVSTTTAVAVPGSVTSTRKSSGAIETGLGTSIDRGNNQDQEAQRLAFYSAAAADKTLPCSPPLAGDRNISNSSGVGPDHVTESTGSSGNKTSPTICGSTGIGENANTVSSRSYSESTNPILMPSPGSSNSLSHSQQPYNGGFVGSASAPNDSFALRGVPYSRGGGGSGVGFEELRQQQYQQQQLQLQKQQLKLMQQQQQIQQQQQLQQSSYTSLSTSMPSLPKDATMNGWFGGASGTASGDSRGNADATSTPNGSQTPMYWKDSNGVMFGGLVNNQQQQQQGLLNSAGIPINMNTQSLHHLSQQHMLNTSGYEMSNGGVVVNSQMLSLSAAAAAAAAASLNGYSGMAGGGGMDGVGANYDAFMASYNANAGAMGNYGAGVPNMVPHHQFSSHPHSLHHQGGSGDRYGQATSVPDLRYANHMGGRDSSGMGARTPGNGRAVGGSSNLGLNGGFGNGMNGGGMNAHGSSSGNSQSNQGHSGGGSSGHHHNTNGGVKGKRGGGGGDLNGSQTMSHRGRGWQRPGPQNHNVHGSMHNPQVGLNGVVVDVENSTTPRTARSRLLEDFRANRMVGLGGLSDLVGHVVEFARDQHGSRFIQQKLETASQADVRAVFDELRLHGYDLVTDVFGNYVIQKLFEYGDDEIRRQLVEAFRGKVVKLSLQMYGCRVIQKALRAVDEESQEKLVLELEGSVLRCIKDQNGNHVIQKCIETLPPQRFQFILNAFHNQVCSLSMHPYGCRVIQRILEYGTGEQNTAVMDEIHRFAINLVQDQYGNYVIQHVVEQGSPEDRNKIVDKIKGHILLMSQHKYASNVVEKCLMHAAAEQRDAMIAEVLSEADGEVSSLYLMMKDQYANYVVQKMLDAAGPVLHHQLLAALKPHVVALRRFPYGKHIILKVEEMM
eukprot:CFRG5880T1